ncbi:MAG: YcaO-like family protein [Bacteroidota bacterium]
MTTTIDTNHLKSARMVSPETGILSHLMRMSRLNEDPRLVSYGIWPGNTEPLGGEKFGGRSSGCGWEDNDALLGTVGETLERYSSAFYNLGEALHCSYDELPDGGLSVSPEAYALFHPEQYADKRFHIKPFTRDLKRYWFKALDLTTGQNSYVPGEFIYLPFTPYEEWITLSTSTGLAAHTSMSKCLLTALYESIERDSFVITWLQGLTPPKIKIDADIRGYLDEHVPGDYEWHFIDITYDTGIPSVFGICIGEAEFGPFVAVGCSTRPTLGEAIRKAVKEISQGIPYFRFLLGEKKDWTPTDDFFRIQNFEQHSIFYTKRPDLWHVFDRYREPAATKKIDFYATTGRSDQEEVRHVLRGIKEAGCNVFFRDTTTPDVRQSGFYTARAFVPQFVQLAGAYPFYYNGAPRLYEVPAKMGYPVREYADLVKYPHPFP